MKEDTDDHRNGNRGGRGKGNRNSNNFRDRSRSPHDRSNISARASRRVYVANVPFDVKWSELKDLFREKVGNVVYCQLFEDEQGRSRGCGLIEFNDVASAQKAIDTLHRFDFKNRELVVKEDLDCERDRYGRLLMPGKMRPDDDMMRGGSGPNRMNDGYDNRFVSGGPGGLYDPSSSGIGTWNTYGLSPQFLDSLGIDGPLNNRIFVANLDYKVGEKKLEEIFRLAGKVLRVRLYTDSSGQSKGHGTVEFDHPVEAVQAISMFNDQKLYGRGMSIRMDKYECEDVAEVLPSKLPSGLESIGKGLGIGGQPLNVSKSLLGAAIAPPPVAVNQASVATGQVVGNQSVPGAMGQHISTTINTGLAPQQASGVGLGLGDITLDNRTATLTHQNALGQTISSSLGQPLGASMAQSSMVHSTGVGVGSNNGIYSSHMTSQPTGTVRGLGVQQSQVQQQQQTSMVVNSIPSTGGGMYDREFRTNSMMGSSVPPSANMSIGMMSGPLSGPRSSGASLSETVIIRNLPPTVSWQTLRDRFSEVGDVRYAELKGPGTALIRFGSERDAQVAVEMMNGYRFENRLIEVSFYY